MQRRSLSTTSWFLGIFLALAMTIAVCAWLIPGETTPTTWFQDVTNESGLDFLHVRAQQTNYWLPEIMSGGAGWLDYDGDGDLDLYLLQGGTLTARSAESPGNRLFRNEGRGTFQDVTAATNVGDQGYGMGCACGDYDQDGDVDLYITNVGPNVLYRNNGDGTFTDVTSQAGVGDGGWGTSCAFLDYDADGDLDLFVTNYVLWSPEREPQCFAGTGQQDYCTPNSFNAPAPDTLYRNQGDGTFVDVSEEAGIHASFGNGLGVTCGDFNADDRLDIYVANDGMVNQLWINSGDGRFQDQALLAGCAANTYGVAEAGMGVAAVDVEGDGDLDLFMTHLREESNTFYLNENGLFQDVTPMTGLSAASIPYTGFGMGFADFDNDGQLDLFIGNGRVGYYEPILNRADPYGEPNQLFRGLGGGRFEEVLPQGGVVTDVVGSSRAVAFADYDNDGDIDLAIVNSGSQVQILRNEAGQRGNWIKFRLLDQRQQDVSTARVRIAVGGQFQWRTAHPAYSYCASNDPSVHFGLGQADQLDEVLVIWPSGLRETFGPFPAGAVHELREQGGRSAGPKQ